MDATGSQALSGRISIARLKATDGSGFDSFWLDGLLSLVDPLRTNRIFSLPASSEVSWFRGNFMQGGLQMKKLAKKLGIGLVWALIVLLAVTGLAADQDPPPDPGGDSKYYYPGNGGNNSYSS